MLPVVLFRHEIWYLTSSDENRLKVLVKRLLNQIFGAKREENAQ
jgi:hypothetical protein